MAMSCCNPSSRAARRERAEEILAERAAWRDPKTGERWEDINCAEGCPGWAVFETDRGWGVQACDECNAIAKKKKRPVIKDYEARELPAAKREHQRHLVEFGDGEENPRSVLAGPAWDAAREKLRGAASGARKNPPLETEADYKAVIAELVKWAQYKHHSRAMIDPILQATPQARELGIDRPFWLGEVLGDMRLQIAANDQLSPAVRNNVMLEIDRVIDRFRPPETPRAARAEWTRADELREQARLRKQVPRYFKNHAPPSDAPSEAIDKYEEFHRYEAKNIGEFAAGFSIPAKMYLAGDAKWTTYRSSKVDPSTLEKPRRPVNYIHEHDAGVHIYLPVAEASREIVDDAASKITHVPQHIQRAEALVKLGDALGFAWTDYIGDHEAEGAAPLPELYCTPDGKCLLVVQDKREVLAMIWGGGLGVFARGIDG